MSWSLNNLFSGLHSDIQNRLDIARTNINHSVTKGDASESVWTSLFKDYLPKRYSVSRAFIVDSQNNFSDQMDIVIFDQQYSPFIFKIEGATVLPAESVYAVFEAKQTVNAEQISYAQNKLKSVRSLHRTSLPIPHAAGIHEPKKPTNIIGGILSLASDWNPPLGNTLLDNLANDKNYGLLNIGCIAEHGYFEFDENNNEFIIYQKSKATTAFLLKLISKLQNIGTVSMIDVDAYSKWVD